MKLIDKIIKILIEYKYKKEPFMARSLGIDENREINILTAEYYQDHYRYGTREERYKAEREEAINNLNMISVAFVEPVTKEQRKIIDDTFDLAIKALEQEPKTGRWILKYSEDELGERYSYWACSECGRTVGFNLSNIEDVLSDYPYCHCGAKMETELRMCQ